MTYDEFVKQVENKFMHETIYKDSEGRPILVIQLLDAYYMMSKLPREWVGLTEDETDGLIHSATYMDETDLWHLVSLVEERLKEKNNG